MINITKECDYNMRILKVLKDIIHEHPELRFGQIIETINGNKEFFYEEPWNTLERFQKWHIKNKKKSRRLSLVINVNQKDIHKKLDSLGYTSLNPEKETNGLDSIITFEDRYLCTSSSLIDSFVDSELLEKPIYCDKNVGMFFDLANYREDTDQDQWFIDDINGVWIKSSSELPDKYLMMNGHKATVEEIIKKWTQK